MSHNKPHHTLHLQCKAVYLIAAAVISVIVSGCKKTPAEVIPQEEMAQLMADIHLGEAMVDFNYAAYPNDSTRKLLKQSIYKAHNVSAEDVDTSFVWYGNHIEEYIKVYDRTIEIIQERQRSIANAANTQISVAGDSVQVWSGPQRLAVTPHMASRIIAFSLVPDSTWRKGDVYTLKYKPVNVHGSINSTLLIDYSNGTTAYVNEPDTRKSQTTLQIQVDTTLTPVRIYGHMTFPQGQNKYYEVDSIALTRIRRELLPITYIRQHTFTYGTDKPDESTADSESSETIETPQTSNHRPRPTASPASRHENASENLPKASSEFSRPSDHRRDAIKHKPTQTQRRDAARQRSRANAVPVKKNSGNTNATKKTNE